MTEYALPYLILKNFQSKILSSLGKKNAAPYIYTIRVK